MEMKNYILGAGHFSEEDENKSKLVKSIVALRKAGSIKGVKRGTPENVNKFLEEIVDKGISVGLQNAFDLISTEEQNYRIILDLTNKGYESRNTIRDHLEGYCNISAIPITIPNSSKKK
jgi:hypothetical protein